MALECLRDLSMLKWYVVPMLLIVVYLITKEVKESRATGNRDPVLAVLVLPGCDFFSET